MNSSAAAAVLFKRLACWGDATWLASNRERLFIFLLLPSLRGLLPDATSACPSECGAPPSSSATPSSDSGSLHLIQAQSFSRFLCRPSQLLGPRCAHLGLAIFCDETDASGVLGLSQAEPDHGQIHQRHADCNGFEAEFGTGGGLYGGICGVHAHFEDSTERMCGYFPIFNPTSPLNMAAVE